MYTLKKIGTLPNLKRFRSMSAECFLGSADSYETLKVLNLGTGSVKHLFFLECKLNNSTTATTSDLQFSSIERGKVQTSVP